MPTASESSPRRSSRCDRLTLYASSLDKALVASRKIHRYARAGDAGDDIVIVEGLDSIDASAVDTSLLGHSYFGDNRSVISDIYNLLRSPGQPAPVDSGSGPNESRVDSISGSVRSCARRHTPALCSQRKGGRSGRS